VADDLHFITARWLSPQGTVLIPTRISVIKSCPPVNILLTAAECNCQSDFAPLLGRGVCRDRRSSKWSRRARLIRPGNLTGNHLRQLIPIDPPSGYAVNQELKSELVAKGSRFAPASCYITVMFGWQPSLLPSGTITKNKDDKVRLSKDELTL